MPTTEADYLSTVLPALLDKFTVDSANVFTVPGGDGGAVYRVREVPIKIPDPMDLTGTGILKVINWRYGVLRPGHATQENIKELAHKSSLAIRTWAAVYPGFLDYQNETSIDPPAGQGTIISGEIDFSIRYWPIHLTVGGKRVKDNFQFILYKENDLINETALPYIEDGKEIMMLRLESKILSQLPAVISPPPAQPAVIVGRPVARSGDYENKVLDFEVYVESGVNEATPETWRVRESETGSLYFWKLNQAAI